MIKIFDDDEPAWKILVHVLEQGIAGIAGGRMSTRNKLVEVKEKARSDRHVNVVALSTVHHFWGELAFIYDEQIYRFQEAKQLVVEAYDKQLAAKGIFHDTYPGS
ncbi:hypothetical protein [Pseudomonas atacamensis]|uniref:hypothetical protein n=1 Tax=Pseudomonas atacamensis TaxID=2565368 RepID=UPI000F038A49